MNRHLAADHDNEDLMIDSTISGRTGTASPDAWKREYADQAIGRLQGGLSTKIHAIRDAAGKAVALFLNTL
ncbi:hypothetical protein AOE01nite_12230 [Acetobacter oeni]|uniref:Transposase IS4-like domain-containing protein n=1 Tax=Acetobacter oeni TaxID=304077 RepID=A0A511XJ87_9PROT|nr:hypothetical protein [Acetobacter oeni]MBB3882814.1 hypothetical protein [Acetobacter oeni]NHO18903.1 hypothetical protein [Acetobacter oeni]GBR09614.1 hypothetical protein AA21952_2892 [Acetobacter oeni LMG 21952]GEN62999.1 hypothetical protein AOE01nite_12230 [Acetobacter oeni]